MYDTMADIYDGIYATKDYSLEVRHIEHLLHDDNCLSYNLLDIGCGTGNHAPFFANFTSYTGIDPTKEMIIRANEKQINNAQFIHSSLAKLDDKSYDVIVSLFNVVNHIHDLNEVLDFFRDISRVSSTHSRLIFDVWNGVAAIADLPTTEIRNVDELEIKIDPVFSGFNQALTTNYTVHRDNTIIWRDSLKMTLWTPKVLVECLKISGWAIRQIYTGFGKNDVLTPAKSDDYKILFYCEKIGVKSEKTVF